MDDKIISADDHLDLDYQPTDIRSRNMSSNYAERAPQVDVRDGSARWICDGKVWGTWRGAAPGCNKRPDRSLMTALERGGYDDRGERRAGTEASRSAAQETIA